ncbi:MAG: toll/interleukin-1 receptor domain-containing protein [Anaerolineales bacterium]|nr:toll/interleukin-1 receptor domain-containing protein [Anaerolineales bacterium]
MTNKLRVFLCHSSTDKPIVREIYQRLESETWLDPWLDEENLLPGMDWDMEIEKAVEAADVVLVCVSNNSVTKEGYVQRELKFALDVALEKPEGTIFIVPLRLDDCNLPRRLRTWQYVDYFPVQQRERAYQRLLQSLKIRHQQGFSTRLTENIIPQPVLEVDAKIENSDNQKIIIKDGIQSQSNNSSLFDWVGYLILLIYFVIEVIVYINDTTTFLDYAKILLLTFSSIYFITKRQLPISPSFKITILIYMFLYPIVFLFLQSGNEFSPGWALLMISSVLVGGSLISVFQALTQKAVYSALSLAGFLFLIVTQLILQLFGIYDSPIFIMQFIVAIATSVLMWKDL